MDVNTSAPEPFQISRDLGWGFLEKLARQKVLQVQSASDPPKKLALGERSVMADGAEYTALVEKDKGAPIEVVYATEGSPLTPTYYAMSMLFHVTAPGWQIIGVEPWESNDWTVPAYQVPGGATSDDTPEKELVAYAGPNGELTVVGLDTRGRNLNTASPDAPDAYSIGGLPPNTSFNLAVWNATGDGTNSVAGTVTTNAAGVARFAVPLQAAFALTTVPVS